MNSDIIDLIHNLLIISVIIAAIVVVVIRAFSLQRLFGGKTLSATSSNASNIIAYYSAGHGLVNAARGKVNNMGYSILLTGPLLPESARTAAFVTDEAIIYTLDLPFNTEAHIVGLSKKYSIDRLQFASFLITNGMEKVNLEGDFSDHFDIYAVKGQQFQVRYVLNPEAMQYVANYCTAHFWEINSSEMYFVASTTDAADRSNIVTESLQFVQQIQPALKAGEPGAPAVHHDVPYGEYDGPALSCAICAKAMTMHEAWQACPAGHGILLNGRDLVRLAHHELVIDNAQDHTQPHQQLNCPNCHNPLTTVSYEGDADIQIDSCEHCPFRWLDSAEVTKLSQAR